MIPCLCYGGVPDLSESPLGYKDATKVKDQIERFGLATVVGEIQPQGCIMAGQAPEPPWARARCEKRAEYKAARREGAAEVGETLSPAARRNELADPGRDML